MANKRERSINWEQEEKQLLREIMKPFKDIIGNKDLSTNTNRAKIAAWTDITDKFNTANKRHRDRKQIINQWKCMKISSKKEISEYRREIVKTGGGPKPPSPSPETLDIIELIPQEFEIDSNEFDCDGIPDTTPALIIENIAETAPQSEINNKDDSKASIIHVIENEPNNKDIKLNYNREENKNTKEQKKITSKPFTTPKRVKVTKQDTFNFGESSYADMHNFRVLENERLQKEHEQRMKNMAEVHSLVIENLNIQKEILHKALESYNKK